MYGAEPRHNDLRYNTIPGLTMGISLTKCKVNIYIYFLINLFIYVHRLRINLQYFTKSILLTTGGANIVNIV